MPQPTNDTAIQRPDLAAVVSEYRETAVTGMIGKRVLPVFRTSKQTAGFPVIPKEVMLKIHKTNRAMRGAYRSSDWEFEDGFYFTRENGWEERIDDRERKLYATLFDAEVVATQRAARIVDMNQELRIASKVFNPTNFAVHNLVNEWDDAAGATPIDDVNAGRNAIRQASGLLPNILIIAWTTFQNLKNCDQIVDRLKYTFPGIDLNRMTTQELARVFDVPQVLVGGAIYDSADKGKDAVIADVWSDEYAMLTVVSEAASISEPCIGRTFMWDQENAGEGNIVESYRDEPRRSDVVRVRHDSDERFIQSVEESGAVKSNIAAAVSYLFGNVTTHA
jgi:hypothetical protein